MPKIHVDGQTIECKDRQMIIQACNDAGIALPQYCYHPGLSIPASCRICLVEVEGIPKLVPSCQTPIRDGMVVHSKSTKAIANQKQVMEYLLINHPLDCPVCDQAGECYLQDYSYQYGRSQSRFEEDKIKNPKKDVGDKVMLYSDRCIMCTRCVRFTREVSGTSELYVDGRGHKEEIDIFPGRPINNKLAGNVVDLCPVGALLDKDFLFKQRVWLLKNTPSISPVDSGGENIYLNHNENVVYRIKPRYNADVNQWWISDDTRYSYKILEDETRLRQAKKTQYGTQIDTSYATAVEAAGMGLAAVAKDKGAGSLYAMLSPMMACEEAYLLGKYIRSLDPQAVLVLGPVPTTGENEVFKNSLTHKQTFVIQAEKVPNKNGIQRVMNMLGGATATFDEFIKAEREDIKKLAGGWIVGGYLSIWIPADTKFPKGFKVLQDVLPTSLSQSADVVLPAATWAEKDGSWENFQNRIQVFAGIIPAEGTRREGDVYYTLLGRRGLYHAQDVRSEMGEPFALAALPSEKLAEPAFEFAELQIEIVMIEWLYTHIPAWFYIAVIAHLSILGTVAYLILLERKVASWAQDRIGPNRVGLGGLLPLILMPLAPFINIDKIVDPIRKMHMGGLGQPLADGLKFILKEDYRPKGVDRVLFTVAPMVMITVVIISIAVLPWGGIKQTSRVLNGAPGTMNYATAVAHTPPGATIVGNVATNADHSQVSFTIRYPFQIASLNIGVLFVLATLSLAVYGVVIGGWASNNKYSFLGGLRATANMISYEIPLGLAVLSIVVVSGTLDLNEIVTRQAHYWGATIGGVHMGLPAWNVFSQPIAFILFLICMHAEANRAPFDLAECEQELVGGYHTEYSAMRFALFFLAEYAGMITTSAVCVALFFGGWHLPGLTGDVDPHNPAITTSLVVCIIRALVFFGKTVAIVFVFMWTRWSLPRFRFDQLMQLAWRGLIPVSLALMAGSALVVYWWGDGYRGNPNEMLVPGQMALALLVVNLAVSAVVVIVSRMIPAAPDTNRKIAIIGSRFARTPLPAGVSN